MNTFHLCFNLFACRCKGTALYRLHNKEWHIVFPKHLIQSSGLDQRIVPVSIVHLDLDNFDLRMLGENLVKQLRRSVEGETKVFDQSLFFFLLGPVKTVVFHIAVIVCAVLDTVQQVIIKVACSGARELIVENAVTAFDALVHHPLRKFGCQSKAFSRMTLYQRFFHDALRFSAAVHIGGVKIVHSGGKVRINHFTDLLQIQFSVLLRKAHHAKS